MTEKTFGITSKVTSRIRHSMKPLFARKDDPIKERHLIANQDISKDELIFVERPLLSLQSIGNAHQGALCCRCCRSFVGGPDLAISVASGKINRENIWDFHRENKQDLTSCCDINIDTDIDIAREDNYRMVPCRNGCGEIFCSQDCEEEMWSCGGHDLLCTGLIPEPESQSSSAQANENADFCDQLHPLLQFKVFAVQNNEIFIMVADLIAAVVSIRRQQIAFNRKNQASSVEANSEVMLKELLAPYLDFTLVPWWEVATAPLISDPMKMVECIDLNRILKELCSTAAKLLFDAFSNIDGDDEFKETLEISMKESQEEYGLFTEDFFGKIIGSFEQNAMGLRSRNPLCRDILEDTELRKRRHGELVKCIELAGMIGDESGEHGEEEDVDMDSNENSDGNGDIGSSEHQNSAGAEEEKYETQRDCDDMYSIDDIAEFISGLDIDEEGLSTSTKVDGESHGDEEEDGGGDDLDNLFTPLDGTCMYSTACKMNHSCEPNVVARYNYSCASGGHLARWGKDFPLVLQCVALKHIKEGEELCISYIKSDAPLQERQAILSNYGFCCECTKCTREKGTLEIQHEGEQQQLNDDLFGEEDLFGDEDEDELFGGPEEVENDTEDDCVGAALLIERVKNLNRSEIASTAGSVPISILAPAFSFVNQMGTQILQELDSSRNDEAPVMEMIKATLKSLRERDIIEIKKIAREGETLTLSLLHKFGGWPSSSLREAHGCFCVVSSICHAEDGNFLPAIRFLDKAAVFGLPRGRLDGFFKYVESHVSRIACSHTAAFKIPNVVVGDYRSPELQQEVISRGLDASILNPITEIGAKEMSSDYLLGNQQIVIRNYAAEWPAIHKWR